jgi:hypothetical protein
MGVHVTHPPRSLESPPGFGVRPAATARQRGEWLAGNRADNAFDVGGRRVPGPKAVCALTPHPPHSKTLARRSQHPLFVGSGPEPPPSLVAQTSNLLYRLQGTTNLVGWADLGAYTNQSGTLVLTFPMPPGRDAYFYRTASRPPTTPPAVPAPSLSEPNLLPNGSATFLLHKWPPKCGSSIRSLRVGAQASHRPRRSNAPWRGKGRSIKDADDARRP